MQGFTKCTACEIKAMICWLGEVDVVLWCILLVWCVVCCCYALCPFGLSCQRFGMVWDAGNDVGLNKLHFPVYYCFLCPFSLGHLGVSVCGLVLGRAVPLGGGTIAILSY